MGFISTMVILNDCLAEIGRDKDFGYKVERAVLQLASSKPISIDRRAFAIETHHNSGYVPVLVGHGTGVVLAGAIEEAAPGEELEITFLRRLAERHGFRLVKKPTRKEKL